MNDLISQKPFIWNNNDPIKYDDPSGYDDAPEYDYVAPDTGPRTTRCSDCPDLIADNNDDLATEAEHFQFIGLKAAGTAITAANNGSNAVEAANLYAALEDLIATGLDFAAANGFGSAIKAFNAQVYEVSDGVRAQSQQVSMSS